MNVKPTSTINDHRFFGRRVHDNVDIAVHIIRVIVRVHFFYGKIWLDSTRFDLIKQDRSKTYFAIWYAMRCTGFPFTSDAISLPPRAR